MKAKYLIILASLLLVADQVSKIFVKLNMTLGQGIEVLGEWFQILFIENPGAAFGMELSGDDWGKTILSLFRILACILLFIYIRGLWKKGNTPRGVLVGMTMILVGALGNVIDCMFYGLIFDASSTQQTAQFVEFGHGYAGFLHGKVVDMISFEWFPPIFNLADTYISVAAGYLIIFQYKFFAKESEGKKKSKK